MCKWISLTSLLVLGGMLFTFGSTCAASDWVWYTFSTCLWAILPSRQMAVFWCCKKDPDLLKTQIYLHIIGTHFCMLLLTFCQVCRFYQAESFFELPLYKWQLNFFKQVTVTVLWKWYFELYFMSEECLFWASKWIYTDLSRFNKIKVVHTMNKYEWYKFDIKYKTKNLTGVIKDMLVILQMDSLGCLG